MLCNNETKNVFRTHPDKIEQNTEREIKKHLMGIWKSHYIYCQINNEPGLSWFATVSCRSHAALSSRQQIPYSPPRREYDSINAAAAAPLVSAPRACGGGAQLIKLSADRRRGSRWTSHANRNSGRRYLHQLPRIKRGRLEPLLNTFIISVSVSQTLTSAKKL